jgi:hypothetical protein
MLFPEPEKGGRIKKRVEVTSTVFSDKLYMCRFNLSCPIA